MSRLTRMIPPVLVFAAACRQEERAAKPPEPPPEPAPMSTIAVEPAPVPEPIAKQKLTAAELGADISDLSISGKVPHGVAIRFAVAVVDPSRLGKISTDTKLAISPRVEGQVRIDTAFTFTFTPSTPFQPGTKYTARLEAVETRDGVIAAPSRHAWEKSFETPPFGLVELEPRVVDPLKGRVEAKLTFSGPVDARVLSKHLSWTIGRAAIQSAAYRKTKNKEVILADLDLGRSAKENDVLTLMLAEGMPMAGSKRVTSAAAERSLNLRLGDPMEIKLARVSQSREGTAIEILCDDRAVAERTPRYYNDDYGEIETSVRCELSEEDAAAGVHLDPPVKFTIGPTNGGFRILGDFKRGTYTLRIDAGARTIDGGVLLSTYEEELQVNPRPASVSFGVAGRYLPRSSWSSLPIRHVNLESPRLIVRQVPPENLVFWMSDDDNESATERTSNVIAGEVLALGGELDLQNTTWIDLGARLPRTTKGLLEVAILSNNAPPATARILMTDLHLVVKRGAGEVVAWALDAATMKPLEGADVTLVKKSGQVVARCRTRHSDACRLVPEKSAIDAAAPFAVIARRGEDLTYLKFNELKTEISDAAIAGEPYRAARPYSASIYTDRGVYRPADTTHVVAILRDVEGIAPPPRMPFTVELIDPRNRVTKKLALETSSAGMASFDHLFPPFASTGRYRLELKVAGNMIKESSILVEEFVPERMKLGVEMNKASYLRGEKIEVSVHARYLFGSAPSGSRVELVCRLEPSIFEPKQNTTHSFALWRNSGDGEKAIELGLVTGELDKNGTGTFECPNAPDVGGHRGTSRVRASISVFEAGSGRTTHAEASALVHAEKFYVGLSGPSAKVRSGQELRVSGVVVDWNGASISAVPTVDVELVRLELDHQWWYDEEGAATYAKTLRPVTIGKQKLEVRGGEFVASWKIEAEAIGFVVRARAGATESAIQLAGGISADFATGGVTEKRTDVTPRPDRPSWIAISSAETIAAGQPAELRFRAPYRGMALFTVETDRLAISEWKEIEAGEQTWTFVLDRFVPNVYASVFILKDPHLESAEVFLPDRAFGVRSIAVEPTAFLQPFALNVPKEVRSSSTLAIELDFGLLDEPTFVTIAAVDEGILSLTRFATPNPLRDIFSRRALGVETFETIGWSMVLPPGSPTSRTGGDTRSEELGRVQPVKPVALWSGVREVPESGKLRVELPVPLYRGALRVMAISAGTKRIGRAEAIVAVRDPLVVQSTLPRFMTAGDEAEIPVFITNLSGAKQEIAVTISSENLPVPGMRPAPSNDPPIEVLGAAEAKLTLLDKKADTVTFRIRALKQAGAAKLRVRAKAKNLSFDDEADVPLLPAGPRSRIVQRFPLEDGRRELAPYLDGWVPTSERTTFWVTANPYGEAFDHLKYLLTYPYG